MKDAKWQNYELHVKVMVLQYYHCFFELVIMFLYVFVLVWFDWAVTGTRPDDEVSLNPSIVLWGLINLDIILIGQIVMTFVDNRPPDRNWK